MGLKISSAPPKACPSVQRSGNDTSTAGPHPPLDTGFRFEWNFKNEPVGEQEPAKPPNEQMRHLGVIQNGDPVCARSPGPTTFRARRTTPAPWESC